MGRSPVTAGPRGRPRRWMPGDRGRILAYGIRWVIVRVYRHVFPIVLRGTVNGSAWMCRRWPVRTVHATYVWDVWLITTDIVDIVVCGQDKLDE